MACSLCDHTPETINTPADFLCGREGSVAHCFSENWTASSYGTVAGLVGIVRSFILSRMYTKQLISIL